MTGPATLRETSFSDLQGWQEDDVLAAFHAWKISAQYALVKPYKTRRFGADSDQQRELTRRALASGPETEAEARAFFETCFAPYRVVPESKDPGFLTGYFEPEVPASATRSDRFRYPLYRQPGDLVEVEPGSVPGLDADCRFGRHTEAGTVPFFDRAAIEDGALSGRGLELVWLDDPVDRFFIHVQGAARLRMQNGETRRVTFAAKTGHPYTSVARLLCERDGLPAEKMTADRLAAWMRAYPDEADRLIRCNQSYIFFREVEGLAETDGPVAAAKIPLTAGRSLAVDRTLYTFGTPIWLNTTKPLPGEERPLQRLMVAHDTGSAITGPARGDYFAGSGEEAGLLAGRIRHDVSFTLLLPREEAL